MGDFRIYGYDGAAQLRRCQNTKIHNHSSLESAIRKVRELNGDQLKKSRYFGRIDQLVIVEYTGKFKSRIVAFM